MGIKNFFRHKTNVYVLIYVLKYEINFKILICLVSLACFRIIITYNIRGI
jgi:hypothetical protein